MITSFKLSLTTAFLLSSALSLSAQERIRSSDFVDGEKQAVEPCENWDVGFEFMQCERMPLPADPSIFGQTYTLDDGSRRTLTADPGSGDDGVVAAPDGDDPASYTPANPAEMAANSTKAVEDSADEGEKSGESRDDLDSAIAEDAAARNTSDADGDIETSTLPPAIGEEENDEGSDIVEEDFVLPPVVATIPGRAEIMNMATGHLNRIETPFADPVIRTSADKSSLQAQFDHQFVYVSITQPVTLFIHEKDHPDPAIVVSLVPQRIAPRQVKVTLPPTAMNEVEANKQQAATRSTKGPTTSQASAEPKANSKGVRREAEQKSSGTSLPHIIQTFAQGSLPSGFSQISLAGWDARAFCDQGGVTFSFKQGAGIVSNEYVVVRGMAEATRDVDLIEQSCARYGETLAVAFAPRTRIGPDHPTDFYVLYRRPAATVQSSRRKEQ